MYKCNNCDMQFTMPKVIVERHNLDTPPFEKLSVCPGCNSSQMVLLLEDKMKRSEVLERCLQAVMYLNVFVKKLEGVLSEEALADFDAGHQKLYELIDYAAVGISDFRLPTNFAEMFCEAVTDKQFELLYALACRNIEEG